MKTFFLALNAKQRQINMTEKNKMFPLKCKVCGKTFYTDFFDGFKNEIKK